MLRYLTAGESHGPQLTAILDGLPAGLPIDLDRISFQMARRQKGYGRGGRMKIETDQVSVRSGLRHGRTLGSPITLVIENLDWSNWSRIMDPFVPLPDDLNLREQKLALETTSPRPGHADLAGAIKFNQTDMRNILERASARETAARVAVGCLARQLLEQFDVRFASHVIRIGSETIDQCPDISDLDQFAGRVEESEVRCADKDAEERMVTAIREAKKSRDSLGGVVELIVRGLPAGLGGFAQGTDRLDSLLAGAMVSIPSVKGVSIGLGFRSAELHGSQVQDEIFYRPGSDPRRRDYYRTTNNAGGIEGGITNGEDIVLQVAAKPISTLNRPLRTVDVITKEPTEALVERTDNCIVPVLGVVCEAVAALVLADVFLAKFGADNFDETKRNFDSWLLQRL